MVGSRSVIGDGGTSRVRLTRGVDVDGKEELRGEGIVLDEADVGLDETDVDLDETDVGGRRY